MHLVNECGRVTVREGEGGIKNTGSPAVKQECSKKTDKKREGGRWTAKRGEGREVEG